MVVLHKYILYFRMIKSFHEYSEIAQLHNHTNNLYMVLSNVHTTFSIA